MRNAAVWLLLLSQAADVFSAEITKHDKKDIDARIRREPHEQVIGAQADGVDDHGGEAIPRQPGAEYVDSALAQLSKVSRSSSHRRKQSSGLIGNAVRFVLKTIPTTPATAPTSNKAKRSITGPLAETIDLLEEAAAQNNSDALYLLAELNFFGNHSHPRDLSAAYDYYNQLAVAHGNTSAQYMLGVYHSVGLGNVVPRDQAKALLHYTFAAIKGDSRAEMATAYRHHSGIGTTKNCETAVLYYKRVAEKAIKWYRSGPPGGMSWIYESWRIADEEGGVYGEGASAASAGINSRKASVHSDAYASIGDKIEYLDLLAQKGDIKAALSLGKIFYDGMRGLPRDLDLARKYFFLVASKYWRSGRALENSKNVADRTAGRAAGFIGRMYLRGDGLTQNLDRAKMWFERGTKLGDAQSQYGLGLILLEGLGTKQNVKLASELFSTAAKQDYAPAQVQIGRLYLDQGEAEDLRMASNYFELASRYGSLEANYYLGEMTYQGVGREKQCSMAMLYYKNVAEKAEPLVSSWGDANDAYEAGDYEVAFLQYLMAAEQGYERAQNNVAYMLDTVYSAQTAPRWLGKRKTESSSLLENPGMALVYWTRSSRQNNIDSLVKMGDYYYYGVGTEQDVNKAVQCYTGATDYSQSAQALFNLGWMHENGIGLKQDFHLAKRYYDHALEVNEEAYLPVTLSLLKLRMRSAWNTLTNGEIHSIQDEPKKQKDWSLADWIANFLQEDDYRMYDYDDADGYEDMYDDTIGAGDEDYLDAGGVLESILIIGVTTSLVLLLWWRQRMQQVHAEAEDARRQAQQQQQQQQQGQPQQPQQGNPANFFDGFAGWAAGGMGL